MAKVDSTDTSFYMNPAAYSQVKDEKKTGSGRKIHSDKSFSGIFEDLRGRTADALGPLRDLPVSEESVNMLMDDVRSAGDVLKSCPFPEEIIRYKQAVRNFLNYVVQNSYSKDAEEGILNKYKPGFKGRRNTPEAENNNRYVKIQIIDRKLESLAAMLLSSQMRQMELVSHLEEIRGLLIDLLQ